MRPIYAKNKKEDEVQITWRIQSTIPNLTAMVLSYVNLSKSMLNGQRFFFVCRVDALLYEAVEVLLTPNRASPVQGI